MEDTVRQSRASAGRDPAAEPALATRAHRLSLVVNGMLAVLKLAAGFLLGSPALVADGWHSAADLVSSGIAWLGHRLGAEPADEDHHYGHGNLEALAGFAVGLVVTAGGALLVLEGVRTVLEGEGTAAPPAGGEVLAMTAAAISILANLGLARVTHHAGRRVGSLSLKALTWDNLGDAFASAIVLIAIAFRAAGVPELEHFVAAAIGLLVAAMGLASMRAGFDVLMVRVADPELRGRLIDEARAVPEVRWVQSVRIHPLGSDVRVDVEISVDGALTVTAGHDIAHRVEYVLRTAEPAVQDVHVHVNPCLPDGLDASNLFQSPTSPDRLS